jgi:hypothetical protein
MPEGRSEADILPPLVFPSSLHGPKYPIISEGKTLARLLLISSLPSGNDGEGTKKGSLSVANPPGDKKNRQRRSNGRVINMGGGKELAAIRAQIEDLLWPEDGEGRNPDELTLRCAGILYAGPGREYSPRKNRSSASRTPGRDWMRSWKE